MSAPSATIQGSAASTDETAASQLGPLLDLLSKYLVDETEVDFEQLSGVQTADIVRLFLLASTLQAGLVVPETPSNHSLNRAYILRGQLKLTNVERDYLFASMIREGNHNVPGWYWVKEDTAEAIAQRLRGLATSDPEPDAREASIKRLLAQRRAGTSSPDADGQFMSTVLQDQEESVQRVALDYVAAFGSSRILEELSALKNRRPSLAKTVDQAIGSIVVREDVPIQPVNATVSASISAGVR